MNDFLEKLRQTISHYGKKFWTWFLAKSRRYQLWRWLVVIFLASFLCMSIYLTFVAKTSNVKGLKNALEQATEIYDKNDQKAGYLYAQKGTWTSIDDISPNVIDAVLSTEDRNFYKEYGFSVKGIARASLMHLKNKLTGGNAVTGGGSTLTQQLVKNAFLSQEQTLSRKAKEIFIAMQVENTYSKKEILAMYLNHAYFGNGVWGVGDAAKRYFGTTASQLTVPQAATLAGMLTSPNAYNPADHPEASKKRRDVVLSLMEDNNKLTAAQTKEYQATPMVTNNTYTYNSGYKYPYYFDAVISEAINLYGLSESDIMNRGYKIYTSLDQNYQTTFQEDFANDYLFPDNAANGARAQGASVALDPKTGGVAAVVGGRSGTHVFRGYNRGTQLVRSPGSTIKPLAVYAPALNKGYHYDSKLPDELKAYGTNKYTPHNWNNVYGGDLPMYKALAESKNTSAVWLLNKIGVKTGFDSVEKFGITLDPSDENLSLALGGLKKGVSPYQIASAYTAFANDGVRYDPHFITKIVDASGKTIVDNTEVDSTRVLSAKNANEMTSMLIDVYTMGTGTNAKPAGYTIAGKTGSTQGNGVDPMAADTDHWYVGYTPDVVVATWVGYDSSKDSIEDAGNRGGASLFKTQMEGILPYTKETKFEVKAASTMAAENSADDDSDESWWDKIKNAGQEGTSDWKQTADSWLQKGKDALNSLFGN
ncbi:PBP1A family penicillin-binding protein [Lactobacillus sp. AN1001]